MLGPFSIPIAFFGYLYRYIFSLKIAHYSFLRDSNEIDVAITVHLFLYIVSPMRAQD
jgi:hypothetical protein